MGMGATQHRRCRVHTAGAEALYGKVLKISLVGVDQTQLNTVVFFLMHQSEAIPYQRSSSASSSGSLDTR